MEFETKQKIADIERMTAGQMRDTYAEVFGEPTRSGNRQWMFRRIAWRLQSLDEGGLSERALRRARELAREQDIRVIPPAYLTMAPADSVDVTLPVPDFIKINRDPRLPFPGTVLSRKYKGHLYQVTVLPNGFEHDGQVYRSLSAVARAITGSGWNGYLFFNLTEPGKVNE